MASLGQRLLWIVRESRAHISAVDERYFEHLRFASGVGLMLVAAGLACILHSIVPAFCTTTASRTIKRLHILMGDRSTLEEASSACASAVGFAILFFLSGVVVTLLWAGEAGPIVALPLSIMALALPLAVLFSNPELETLEGRSHV